MPKYKFICDATSTLHRRAVIDAATPEEALAAARDADRTQWEPVPHDDEDASYDADYSLVLLDMECVETEQRYGFGEKGSLQPLAMHCHIFANRVRRAVGEGEELLQLGEVKAAREKAAYVERVLAENMPAYGAFVSPVAKRAEELAQRFLDHLKQKTATN